MALSIDLLMCMALVMKCIMNSCQRKANNVSILFNLLNQVRVLNLRGAQFHTKAKVQIDCKMRLGTRASSVLGA